MKCSLLFIFATAVNFSFASMRPASFFQDTTIHQKEYKRNEKEFLAKYGCDDSSRALIQFYFHKRNGHKASFFTGAGLMMLSGIAYFPVNNMLNISSSDGLEGGTDTEIFFVFLIFILAYTGIPLLLTGASLWMRYSRKRLLRILNNYFNGKALPKGISGSKMFKGYLQYGAWTNGIRILARATDAYNKKMLRRKN